jgi:hypothetical protein
MMKKTVYFAHPKVHYDTDFEIECIEIIVNMLVPIGADLLKPSIEIFNPNNQILSNMYRARKDAGDPDPFEVFREIARAADFVVGVTFFDGSIGAGVAEELTEALNNGKETYLIYVNNVNKTKMFIPFINQSHYVVHSIEETRARTLRDEM